MRDRQNSVFKMCLILTLLMCLSFAKSASAAMDIDTFLVVCAQKTVQEVADALKDGADVNGVDEYGYTPLTIAALYNEDVDVTAALIKAGADVSYRDPMGNTPLIIAAKMNLNPEVARTLMEAGIDVNAHNNNGDTALTGAAGTNGLEMIQLLLDAGADAKVKNQKGEMAIDLANQNQKLKNSDVLQKLSDLSK